jgi:4-aminobutyrate aminotransferase-like enzyme
MDDHDLLRDDARYSAFGDTAHARGSPKIFRRCDGSFLYDQDDRPYLDLQMMYSSVNFGYRNPRLIDAVCRQLESLPQLAPEHLHPQRIEVATAIAQRNEATFGSSGRIQFEVGGSQAVDAALRLVRNASEGKSLMFSFEGGYHGRGLGPLAITSSYRYRRPYGHFGERAQFVPFPYCFRCPYGKRREDCELFCVDQFARLFENEYSGVWDPSSDTSEFAAFIVEPIQGTGGYIIPPVGYFEKLKKILDEHKILLIDDEMQVGFFRTGKFWAIEHFNVRPDVIIFGKSLTNGLNPLAGLWARETLINPQTFPPGSTHSTFSANPLGTAAAIETIRLIDDDDYAGITKRKGDYFLEGLRELQRRFPIIGDVAGLGMAFRIEICKDDRFTPDRETTDRIVREALKGDIKINGETFGLVLDVGGYYKNVLTLSPALTISDDELDLALRMIEIIMARIA